MSKDEVKKPTTSSSSSSTTTSSSSTTTSSSIPIQIRDPDEVYEYDAEAVAKQRKEKPWENNVKYFKHCRVSALAAMKMLKHALAGVEKGRRAGTNPVEVMGLMIGKAEGDTIVILDTCPLPVEGTETRVVADEAQTHMIELADSLEERRREGFVGWYHSHPFDVETYSHCHLSATDVQTQFGWQNYTPTWLAIVVDPLRSLARQEPEFGAFRCYPIKYNPPANESPDGTISTDNNERIVRWGVTHNRYYALKISYFMSGLGSQLLDVMSRNNLWVRVLSSSTIMEPENRQRFAERVRKAADKLSASENAAISSGMGMGTLRYGRGGGTTKGGNEELAKGAQACCDLAIEQCKGHLSQISKDLLFNFVQRQAKREAREQLEWEAAQKSSAASK